LGFFKKTQLGPSEIKLGLALIRSTPVYELWHIGRKITTVDATPWVTAEKPYLGVIRSPFQKRILSDFTSLLYL